MYNVIIIFIILLSSINASHALVTIQAGNEDDAAHLGNIATTHRRTSHSNSKGLNYFPNHTASNQYQVTTYAIFGKSPAVGVHGEVGYYWISQDYLLKAANLARFGIRIKSYTIEASLANINNGVSILESSPGTTDPTHTVTSSISFPMNINAAFPQGGGMSMGVIPGWQRSFTAPSTKVNKDNDINTATVKWVYKIHRKSPVATCDFDPSQKWIWKIENFPQAVPVTVNMNCSLEIKYKLKKRKIFKLFCKNYRNFFGGVRRTTTERLFTNNTISLPVTPTQF